MIKKTYLIGYSLPKYLILQDYLEYELQMKVVWFGGLFVTYNTKMYTIYKDENLKVFTNKWNKLIKQQIPVD